MQEPLVVATKEYDALAPCIQLKQKLTSFLANLGRHQNMLSLKQQLSPFLSKILMDK